LSKNIFGVFALKDGKFGAGQSVYGMFLLTNQQCEEEKSPEFVLDFKVLCMCSMQALI